MSDLNRNCAWARILIEELARSGVRNVCISPGSRSAPLALACAAAPELQEFSILDERSAAFFALGLARTLREPVALVCTSGTAAANYLPAIVEAHYSEIPLIALTADRPPEQRDCDAGQTIDQVELYGRYVRFFAELPPPTLDAAALRNLRRVGCRAIAAARGEGSGGGPVHLNLPFREPLAPIAVPEDQLALRSLDEVSLHGRGTEPMTRVHAPQPLQPASSLIHELVAQIQTEERGWIVAGRLDASPDLAHELAELSRRTNWPLICDPLSGLRTGPHDRSTTVAAHDVVIRSRAFAQAHLPRIVLRFGRMPISKSYRELLERQPEIRQWVVDPDSWSEPTGLAEEIVRGDAACVASALGRALVDRDDVVPSEFTRHWCAAGALAREVLDASLRERVTLSESGVVHALANTLPEPAILYCASSLPIRQTDWVWPSSSRSLRILANRGANGIDGTLSSMLGSAVAADRPLIGLCGDLALLHDASGLLLARSPDIDACIVVIDNAGGGIFEFLPVADSADRAVFERHFTTDQGVDLKSALSGFGLDAETVDTQRELEAAVQHSIKRSGVQFVIARCDRRETVELHRKWMEAVDSALASGPPG